MLLFIFLLLATLGVEGTATALAGVVAPVITHVTKKFFGVDSQWAYLIHVGASTIVTILALAINQELSVGSFAEKFTAVAFISQSLFQILKGKSGLKVDGEIVNEPTVEDPKPE